MADVMSGGSYYSQNSFTQYFGVGKAETVDRVEVRWPNGDVQKWSGIRVNRTLSITEGREQVGEKPFSPPAATRPLPARTPKKP
ncbi:MAG: ASPIC/UnbV domain-containing protein [Acidobacteriota bacterium]